MKPNVPPSFPPSSHISKEAMSSSHITGPFPPEAQAALATYTAKDPTKVLVRFKAIGAAPIMKNNAFRITSFNRFQAVVVFLKKELGNIGTGAGNGNLVGVSDASRQLR